ncbi:MAG TPA: NACHT domain-containing protein [Pseudonocardiaceae bacterium]|nr:NACHT domain-containing protein [Pseudonocardiaceae bacterium]
MTSAPTQPQLVWALLSAFTAGAVAYLAQQKPLDAPSLDKGQRRRNRTQMLKRVRSSWITGVFERALETTPRIALSFARRPDAVDHPAERLPRQPNGHALGNSIVVAFDEIEALLILGGPGSGKTMLLLDMARELLDKADRDRDHPIPVVFNLSSWALHRASLAEWMVDELAEAYDVPRKVGQSWVDIEQILPLLDGLDTIPAEDRQRCVEAINAFREDHRSLPMVVCSRTDEYAELTLKLRLRGAVEIQPLTQAEVGAYLEQVGERGAGLGAALHDDPTLWKLVESPLMLTVVTRAYQDRPAAAAQSAGTLQQRRRQLFAVYVDAVFERAGEASQYPRDRTVRWLAWLARSLQQHNQTEFYLERLQRDWLPTRAQQRIVAVGSGLLVVLLAGLFFGLLVGLPTSAVPGLTVATITGLLSGLFYWRGEQSGALPPAAYLRWSWAVQREGFGATLVSALLAGLVVGQLANLTAGLVVGLCTGVFVGLVNGLSANRPGSSQTEGARRSAWNALLVGLAIGLVVGLPVGLANGLGPGLFLGLQAGLLAELIAGLVNRLSITQPAALLLEPTRRSARDALLVGLVVGLVVGLLAGLVFALAAWMQTGLVVKGVVVGLAGGLIVGLSIGLSAGLFYGLGERSRIIKLAVHLQWSWPKARNRLRPMLAFALILGILFALFAGLVVGSSVGVSAGLRAGLQVGVVTVLAAGLIGGLVNGLSTSQLLASQTIPNQGMWRSARNAALVGLAVGLVVGVAAEPLSRLLVDHRAVGLLYGLVAGLVAALFFGGMACVQHLLLRALLVQGGFAPRQYIHFLDYAVECLFLRSIGGGYIFVHRLLLEHFAALELDLADARPAATG